MMIKKGEQSIQNTEGRSMPASYPFCLLSSVFTLLCLFPLLSWGSQQAIPLAELEANLRETPEVLSALAEMERSANLLEAEKSRSGFKIFGSGGLLSAHEPVTNTTSRSYDQIVLLCHKLSLFVLCSSFVL